MAGAHAVANNPDPTLVVPASGGYVPRRMRIVKNDLEARGYTAGCPGCITVQMGDGISRGPHTDTCRRRIEELIEDDRKRREVDRMDQYAAEQLAAGDAEKKEADEAMVESPVFEDLQDAPSAPAETVSAPQVTEAYPVSLQERPTERTENRYRTADRPPAVKRGEPEQAGPSTTRRRIELGVDVAPVAMDDGDGVDLASENGEAQMNQDVGPPSPSQAWYDDIGVYGGTDAATAGGSVDVAMSLLDDTHRRILASVILGVDIVEL